MLELPSKVELPLFVYGALKPGLPGHEPLRPHLERFEAQTLPGQLWVRDGLPLLCEADYGEVQGHQLYWKRGQEQEAYQKVCMFEPRKHYKWSIANLAGQEVNFLAALHPKKGNPVFLDASVWHLSDDPAFGVALDEVRAVLKEVEGMEAGDSQWMWRKFYRAQMAYLLLWSVVERLSALCLGPDVDPMKRINRMHELEGIPEAVANHVQRDDKVADSRDPDDQSRLDASKPKKVFQYYYQVRSNLSHRGKAVFDDYDKVYFSLRELLGIVTDYLESLRQREVSQR